MPFNFGPLHTRTQSLFKNFVSKSRRAKRIWPQENAEVLESRVLLSALNEVASFNGVTDLGYFGNSVAIDGDVAVVGEEEARNFPASHVGSAVVLQRTNGIWNDVATLSSNSPSGYQLFGASVAISGDTIVVSAEADAEHGNNSGAVFVYERPTSGWADMVETAKLTPSDSKSLKRFGESVAIDGTTIVVGSDSDQSLSGAGTAYVFERPTGGWVDMTQTAKLTPSTSVVNDEFGVAVSISNNTIVVGTEANAAYVFARPADGWRNMNQTAKLTAVGLDFGKSVSIDMDTIVVGSPWENGAGINSGAAYLFEKPTDGWVDAIGETKLVGSDLGDSDTFGTSVSISGNTIAIGSSGGEDYETNPASVYLFERPNTGWVSTTETSELNRADGSPLFNGSVAIDGETIIAGNAYVALGEFSTFYGSAFVFQPQSGISISGANGSIDLKETGGSVTLQVVLDDAPTRDVVIDVSSSDTTEFISDVTTLTFTSTNWDTPQAINVSSVDDDILDGLQSGTLTLAVSPVSDSLFTTLGPLTVAVNNADVEENVTLDGTAGNDSIWLRPMEANNYSLSFNGTVYEFEGLSPEIQINGNGGIDRLQMWGGSGVDTVELGYGTATVDNPSYNITVSDVDSISVYGNSEDAARITDSLANDTVFLTPNAVWMQSGTDYVAAHNFSTVTAASSSGNDIARIFDSSGHDTLEASPTKTTLVGSDFSFEVTDFSYVNTISAAGGDDTAKLTDSTGSDIFISKPRVSYLNGDGFFNVVRGFVTVEAFATEGHDIAQHYDSSGTDVFLASPTQASLTGPGFDNIAYAFDYNTAISKEGGADSAQLTDSEGDDVFVGQPDVSYLYGGGFFNVARGFAQVEAFASTGFDTAHFHDSANQDQLQAKKGYAYMYSPKYTSVARTFDSVTAWSTRGGDDTLEIFSDIDYTFQYFGHWDLTQS